MEKTLLTCSGQKLLGAVLIFLTGWLISANANAQNLPVSGTDIVTTATYTIPPNVISLQIECWGGGGGGGGVSAFSSSGFAAGSASGGGGGAYSIVNNVGVTPGTTITITVGTGGTGGIGNNGNPTNGNPGITTTVVYNATTVASAAGGTGGNKANANDGGTSCAKALLAAGGSTGVGFKYAGGNGAGGSGTNCNVGGGGGGGAGTGGPGGSGSAATAGTGTANGGGSGGNGATASLNGANGSNATVVYGGGGGGSACWPGTGSGAFKNATGGNGAQGKVVFTYTPCSPPTGGTISGTTQICASTQSAYAISGVSGATSYLWSVTPTTASVSLGQGTTNVTITWGATGGTVSCVPSNSSGACTETTVGTYAVSLVPTPAQPSTITVPSPICQGNPQVYSVTAAADADHYSWSNTPGGWTGSSTTNSINLTANSSSTVVTVTPFNSCNVAGLSRSTSSISPNLPVPLTPGPIVHQ